MESLEPSPHWLVNYLEAENEPPTYLSHITERCLTFKIASIPDSRPELLKRIPLVRALQKRNVDQSAKGQRRLLRRAIAFIRGIEDVTNR